MAIAENDFDSLELVTLSYGNEGLNADLYVEADCQENGGDVDCTGQTVQVCAFYLKARVRVRSVRTFWYRWSRGRREHDTTKRYGTLRHLDSFFLLP